MKKVIQPVKGTRDFYPKQMAIRVWLYNTMRDVAESFGYQEYEAPMIESLELYASRSGDELVKEQAFAFTDRGGSEITLRPELTLSLARMVAQKQNELNFPVRWWSFGPFWRYERPQRGRTREFFQWNVDMLGVSSPEADAENAAVLATFFQRVGLSPQQVIIKINNRRLMDDRFDALDIAVEKRPAVSSWIDRRDKMSPEAWMEYGKDIELSPEQITKVKEMLADKDLWRQSAELTRFFAVIDALELRQFFEFDPSIVRGLLYYTGTVFEAWEVGGDIKRSILGGGRYDNLTRDVGGDPIPGVGFAMGDVVIGLLLEKYGLLPKDLPINPAPVLVTVFNEDCLLESFKLASELRREGINVVCYPEAAKLQKQFKYADRIGAKVTLVMGPDEVEKGRVAIKNLINGEQVSVQRESLVETVMGILNA
jgi:histidyl-tRNA synthetase